MPVFLVLLLGPAAVFLAFAAVSYARPGGIGLAAWMAYVMLATYIGVESLRALSLLASLYYSGGLTEGHGASYVVGLDSISQALPSLTSCRCGVSQALALPLTLAALAAAARQPRSARALLAASTAAACVAAGALAYAEPLVRGAVFSLNTAVIPLYVEPQHIINGHPAIEIRGIPGIIHGVATAAAWALAGLAAYTAATAVARLAGHDDP